jgi:hypothetical protein
VDCTESISLIEAVQKGEFGSQNFEETMKKALIAAILGAALNVTSSYAQGYIIMENYKLVGGVTPVVSGVTYGAGSGSLSGKYVGAASGWKADLLYSLNGGATYSLAAGSQTPFFPGSQDGGTPTTDGAGTFLGGTVTIPGYTSGSLWFIVEAYTGAGFGQGLGSYNALSAPFLINSLNTNPALPSGDLLQLVGTTATGLQPFTLIPEPSVFALAGLGAAGLMAFRRKR